MYVSIVLPGKSEGIALYIYTVWDDKGEVLSKNITSNYVNEFFNTMGGPLAANIDMAPGRRKTV